MISDETDDQLRRLQDLLRREIPNGDLSAIVARAIPLLLREVEKRKFSATRTPRRSRGTKAGSRSIPAEVQRFVWERDGGQCAFVAGSGRRCSERSFLEFHHVKAYALGGAATVENIALRCHAHNAYEAELVFGPIAAARPQRELSTVPGTSDSARHRLRGSSPLAGGDRPMSP
jgi:hypothetical protein